MYPRTCFGFPGPPIRPRGAREQWLEGPFLTTTHKLSERSPEPDSSSIGHENSGPNSVRQRSNSRKGVNLLRSACSVGSTSKSISVTFGFTSNARAGANRISSADVRAARFYVHRVEGLARGHEEAVALRAAETDVGADFRQQDHADAFARGRENVHAIVAGAHPAGSYPNISIGIGANPVGHARAFSGQLHVDEHFAVAQGLAVDHIVDFDDFRGVGIVRGAGVADVHLFVIG